MRIPLDVSDITVFYQSLAIDSQGRAAVAGSRNSSTSAPICGRPKLSRSSDLVNWRTCAPDATGYLNFSGEYVSLKFTSKDKVVLAFQEVFGDMTSLYPNLGRGVILYREP